MGRRQVVGTWPVAACLQQNRSIGTSLVPKSTQHLNYTTIISANGASPSGKALVFGTSIRRFESCRPSQKFLLIDWLGYVSG
jgi:hypothetical protein